jgi:hypothetical protein
MGKQTNTGRTHFKKGIVAWNKGKKMELTDHWRAVNLRRKGVSIPKPEGFSETMRLVNPPLGRKIKYGSRKITKKQIVWRGGYVFVYKPEHPSSRKVPPDYGYILEHRMVVEDSLGRRLERNEVVHHIDGNKENNTIDNLVLCNSNAEHNGIHTKMEEFVEKLIREGKVYYDRDRKDFFFR